MLSYLADYDHIFGPLRLLRYLTVRTFLGAGTALVIGFIIAPWLIARFRALKFGQHYDDDRTGDLAQKFDKKNTPTMGGLIIFISVFLSTFLWAAPNVWVFVSLFVYTTLTVAGWPWRRITATSVCSARAGSPHCSSATPRARRSTPRRNADSAPRLRRVL